MQNMLKYKTDQPKTKPKASFAKSTDNDAKQTVYCKQHVHSCCYLKVYIYNIYV